MDDDGAQFQTIVCPALWRQPIQFLVIGSARTDIYRNGGDSLRGVATPPKVSSLELVLPSGQVPLFENVVARHLLKLKHALENQEGYSVGLPFLGDADKREVDFLITVEGGSWSAVKHKTSNRSVNPGLK